MPLLMDANEKLHSSASASNAVSTYLTDLQDGQDPIEELTQLPIRLDKVIRVGAA